MEEAPMVIWIVNWKEVLTIYRFNRLSVLCIVSYQYICEVLLFPYVDLWRKDIGLWHMLYFVQLLNDDKLITITGNACTNQQTPSNSTQCLMLGIYTLCT